MSYTVVRFLEENEEEEIISEVPSSWIESKYCWWPSSKNVSILISKGACPDKNKWKKYPVAVLGVVDDYQKARWKADHIESDDTSSSEKGRGKRKKKIKHIEENGDSTSDYDDIKEKVLSKLPEYPSNESTKSEIILEEESDNDENVGSNQDVDNDDEQWDNRDKHSENGNSIQLLTDIQREWEENGVIQDNTIQAEDKLDMTIINVSTDQLIKDLEKHVKDEFAKINRILAKILLELQSMNTGTVGVTTIDLNGDDEFQEIVSQFPITNVDILNDVNERVERDQQCYKKVVLFLKTIGGITLKEKICRILKRVFSNQLIAQASWLGHSRGEKKNFKLSNLKLISAIKDAVHTDEGYTEKIFETVAADWTRQGKQRHTRERQNKVT
ncbi:uncharacterized protein LOC126884459 [Diabrotica virgifera virgifera]|uniref:DUF4806 domain-containing protein n=1 Tax=Diabrotica virgifera virgifera TaxID=50390 RepID=A0ABM5K835_DIAVI|nr:uncharacterized protein LOC126884459 [Diabrotica virgifera virgifera]